MEPKRNIIPVCKECSELRMAETQLGIVEKLKRVVATAPIIKAFKQRGIYVKKAFKDAHGTEHMWVFVPIEKVDFDARELYGTLDNDPVVVQDVSCGDPVGMSFDEVEQILGA